MSEVSEVGLSLTELNGQLGAHTGLLDLLNLELDRRVVVLDPWHVLAEEISRCPKNEVLFVSNSSCFDQCP